VSLAEVGPEVWLAVGYAFFLLVAAHGLDRIARRTASRSGQWRAGGFVYHDDHDAWVCPQDQWLWPQSFDPDNRVMRYRASPTVCNACPVKPTCTTSDHGRQMSRNVDPWPSSEAERFHRAVACTVAVLALLWPLLSLLGSRSGAELALLATTCLVVVLASWPLWSHLRHAPASFPEHVRVEQLDDTVAAARAEAETAARRRTTYASDRRAPGSAVDVARPAGWSRLGGGAP
jgi:hypothetical protein